MLFLLLCVCGVSALNFSSTHCHRAAAKKSHRFFFEKFKFKKNLKVSTDIIQFNISLPRMSLFSKSLIC